MTTIRDGLCEDWDFLGVIEASEVLRRLGIDPDLPAEWATVDRCLTWLRGYEIHRWSKGRLWLWHDEGQISAQVPSQWSHFDAPTLHAALIAACRAVQEAS